VYIFIFLAVIVALIVLGIMYLLLKRLRARILKLVIEKRNSFVYNGYLRSIYVSYIEMCLTVGFQVKMLIK